MLVTYLDRRPFECSEWSPGGRDAAGQDTSHRGGPRLSQQLHSTEFLCRQFHWAGPGTSGWLPKWSKGRSCNLCQKQETWSTSQQKYTTKLLIKQNNSTFRQFFFTQIAHQPNNLCLRCSTEDFFLSLEFKSTENKLWLFYQECYICRSLLLLLI